MADDESTKDTRCAEARSRFEPWVYSNDCGGTGVPCQGCQDHAYEAGDVVWVNDGWIYACCGGALNFHEEGCRD